MPVTLLVPLSAFPDWAQPVIRLNPLSGVLGLSWGGPVLVPVLQTLAWPVAVAVVLAPAVRRSVR